MKFEIGVRVGSKWYYTKAEDSYAALGCMREIGAELMVPEIDMDELVKFMARMLQGELVSLETEFWSIYCTGDNSDAAPET